MEKTNMTHDAMNTPSESKYIVGELPPRCNTIQAEILARLLAGGEPLTPIAAAQMHGAVNLSAHINKLEKKFGWPIQRVRMEVRTFNGRYVMTFGYSLPPSTVEAARKLYGTEWTDEVKWNCERFEDEAKFCMFLTLRKDPLWSSYFPEADVRNLAGHLYHLLGTQ